jgi:hypothetical protein
VRAEVEAVEREEAVAAQANAMLSAMLAEAQLDDIPQDLQSLGDRSGRPTPQDMDAPPSNEAWPGVESEVDAEVRSLMTRRD